MSDHKTLSEVIASSQPEGSGLRFPISPNWAQGRTAFGGFTAALLMAGVEQAHADLPPLRSAMINFTAPLSEPPVITSELLRQGRNMSTIAARAMVADKTAATATFSFGHSQQSQLETDLPADAAPAPSEQAIISTEGMQPPAPMFFGNFDMNVVKFALPFSGSTEMELRVWLRHKDPKMRQGLPGLLAIADFLPPAVLPRLTVLAMNSSVNWMLNILPDDPQTDDGWWLLESRLTATQNGFSSQGMRVWNTDRKLVIDGMQSVVIFEQR